mmetsp:Transcript_14842/g.32025  ORF Transcript_14842/g.32025 Transcript_14842/m.32025 type:complete len:126 (+) Transcript_14842:2055-2432(+)
MSCLLSVVCFLDPSRQTEHILTHLCAIRLSLACDKEPLGSSFHQPIQSNLCELVLPCCHWFIALVCIDFELSIVVRRDVHFLSLVCIFANSHLLTMPISVLCYPTMTGTQSPSNYELSAYSFSIS